MAALKSPDYKLAGIVLFLTLFGLVVLYSISPVVSRNYFGDEVHRNYFFNNQIRSFAAGIFIYLILSRIDYRKWKKLAIPMLIVSVLMMTALLIPGLGVELGGARRWLNLGLFSIQPAEFVKVAMIVYMAVWLENKGKWIRNLREGLLPFSILVGIIAVFVTILQRDLGTMSIMGMTLVGMYFIAGAPWYHLAALGSAAAGSLYLLIVSFPHRLSRITAFLNPYADPQGEGYHIIQVLISIGSGGFFGRGLGQSVQLYGYVPASPTDSIFAIIAEELGFAGAAVLVLAYVWLAKRGFAAAKSAPDTFGRLLAGGLTSMIIFQAVINVAAMLALVPLTGVPLPFISYGGSSLIVTLAAAGILGNISKYRVEVGHADRPGRWRYGWTRLAAIVGR